MTRYQYWLRTGLDPDTGEPTQNPPTINHAPPSSLPHRTPEEAGAMGPCCCMACTIARTEAMQPILGEQEQKERSRAAQSDQERRSGFAHGEQEHRSENERAREEYRRERERER